MDTIARRAKEDTYVRLVCGYPIKSETLLEADLFPMGSRDMAI